MWIYYVDGCEEFKLDSVSGKRTKSIYCMDKYGNFIKEYEKCKRSISRGKYISVYD